MGFCRKVKKGMDYMYTRMIKYNASKVVWIYKLNIRTYIMGYRGRIKKKERKKEKE